MMATLVTLVSVSLFVVLIGAVFALLLCMGGGGSCGRRR